MKLSINEATCLTNSDLQKDIELAERYHYEYIELRIDKLKKYLCDHKINDLKMLFENKKLKVAGYNSIENINFITPEKWIEIEKDLNFICDIQQEIGGEFIVAVPTVDEKLHKNEEEVIKDTVSSVKKIFSVISKTSLKVALEPIGSKYCCLKTIDTAQKVLNVINNPNIGLAVDAFNLYMNDGWTSFEELMKLKADDIICYHIDDSDDIPIKDLNHCNRLFPGNGVIPLKKLSNILKNKGYDGICSLELFNPSYWELEADRVFEIGKEKTLPYI